MGQILQADKIGALSHSSGVITLAVSTLSVGGQQYAVSSLSRTISTDVTMAAATMYYVYAVLSGGVPALRISANVNSMGPAGFTSWKLVGAFNSNFNGSAFGGFWNIEGPTTVVLRLSKGVAQSIPDSTDTKIINWTSLSDSHNLWDTTNSRYYSPAATFASVSASILLVNTTNTIEGRIWSSVSGGNGSGKMTLWFKSGAANGFTDCVIPENKYYLTAGQYIEIMVRQIGNSGPINTEPNGDLSWASISLQFPAPGNVNLKDL